MPLDVVYWIRHALPEYKYALMLAILREQGPDGRAIADEIVASAKHFIGHVPDRIRYKLADEWEEYPA